jgi:hypothetical protein
MTFEEYAATYNQNMTSQQKSTDTISIGYFWDIENCSTYNKSAIKVVDAIRSKFSHFGREVRFDVVCDVLQTPTYILTELNDAQVDVVHVWSAKKNAADDKLKACMARFESNHAPACVVLITSDIDFMPSIHNYRYNRNYYVHLMHNTEVNPALITMANEHTNWDMFLANIPDRGVHHKSVSIANEDKTTITTPTTLTPPPSTSLYVPPAFKSYFKLRNTAQPFVPQKKFKDSSSDE